jgi:hypothetical protein
LCFLKDGEGRLSTGEGFTKNIEVKF